jgi:ribonuclease BN (tRNA processing enzyme)
MIELLILGAGTAVPTPHWNASAYWVEIDGQGFLLDLGPGALIRLMGSAYGPDDIDAIDTIVLSHLHIDHCADLAPLLFALHSPIPNSTKPLQLLGPPGTASYLAKLHDLYGSWVEPAKRELVVQEIRPGQLLMWVTDRVPGWSLETAPGPPPRTTQPRITVFAAKHPQDRFSAASLCFRFCDRENHTVAYSGDTEPTAGLEEASRGVDLLLVECSTPDELATPGHMTPSRVGELCTVSRPDRVVLTHLYPPAAALDLPKIIRRWYGGSVTVARDGDFFTVPDKTAQREN